MERYKNFLLIEVPESAFVYKIYENRILLLNDIVDLPPGNYTILGKGDELTEEQWDKIVDKGGTYFILYDEPDVKDEFKKLTEIGGLKPIETSSAIRSGYSLLKSKNLSPETTLIIQDNG